MSFIQLTVSIDKVDNGYIYNCVIESGSDTVDLHIENEVTKITTETDIFDNYALRNFVRDSLEAGMQLFHKPEPVPEIETDPDPEPPEPYTGSTTKPEDDLPF